MGAWGSPGEYNFNFVKKMLMFKDPYCLDLPLGHVVCLLGGFPPTVGMHSAGVDSFHARNDRGTVTRGRGDGEGGIRRRTDTGDG